MLTLLVGMDEGLHHSFHLTSSGDDSGDANAYTLSRNGLRASSFILILFCLRIKWDSFQ